MAEPVINTDPAPAAGEQEHQQHNKVGGRKFDTIVENDKAAPFRQPAVISMPAQMDLAAATRSPTASLFCKSSAAGIPTAAALLRY